MKPAILDHMPPALLELGATELHRVLDGPTLIHLSGRRPQPLFVSVLQHGNEWSGWDAVRRLLKGRYARDPLPRSLSLLIGNVQAAAEGLRHLPDQPDFNRCWALNGQPETDWHRLFARITRHMRELKPFASIDIHNNTGLNPHYAAVNRIDGRSLQLAAAYSQTVIYFTEPAGVQSLAFDRFCPAVTLECGLAGDSNGTDHALAYLEKILSMDQLPASLPAPEDLDLFRVAATVRVPERVPFGFDARARGIRFEPDLDRLNFTELPPGSRLARVNGDPDARLLAISQDGRDQSEHWFRHAGDSILTNRPMMPAMLSTDPRIISQDCLCYLMERLSLRRPPADPADVRPRMPESLP